MIKVYAIEERQDVHEIENDEFIEIAKEQGTTWKLLDFQNFINWEGSPPFYKESENLCFRFIDVPTETDSTKIEDNDDEKIEDFCLQCDKKQDKDDYHIDRDDEIVCQDCVIETHFFCIDCDKLSPMDMATENTENGFQCVECWEDNPKEIISLVRGNLISNVDGVIYKSNLDSYWTKELTHTYEGVGLDCKDITKEKKYSYINLCSDLIDYYEFVDTCWHNNLVPSMNYDVDRCENGINYRATYWVGFPNSNDKDEENEEWNYFTINFEDDVTKEYFSSMENDIVFETIEDVLGFIESNKNENGGLI